MVVYATVTGTIASGSLRAQKMLRPAALKNDHPARGHRLRRAVAVTVFILIMSLRPHLADADAGPKLHHRTELRPPVSKGWRLWERLSNADLQVAGVRLNRWLVWRLYAAYGFEPIWASRQREAAALQDAILRADGHGLDPNLFHATLIARAAALSRPPTATLVLSDAFLAYADALARGAVPLEKRKHDDETLEPGAVDVVAALQVALAAPDPGKALEALAPNSPTYARLRQVYAAHRATGAQREARVVAVNLERLRWLPRAMPADRVEVNAASAQLPLFRGNVPVFVTRVVVGEADKQTPEMQAQIESILFKPALARPILDRAVKEILPPAAGSDPSYLAHHNMVLQASMGRSCSVLGQAVRSASSNSRCRILLMFTCMTRR